MTLPATATLAGTVVNITGDNGGTLILDSVSGNQDCYQKTNYRGDPHEFGAYGRTPVPTGQSGHDDTVPVQNWLASAYGNVSNLAPGTAPHNFGPWIVTIPGNYLIS